MSISQERDLCAETRREVKPAEAPHASIWAPSLFDFLFLSLLVWLFLAGPNGWIALLTDGDTGWHIRTGQWILSHRQMPQQDFYSFSRPGAPWFAWEWLSEAGMALLYGWAGFKGVVLAAGLLIAASLLIMFRHMLWRGATPLIALPILLLSSGASAIHYLARPHVVTLAFLAAAMWVIDADRRATGPRLWWLVPLSCLWANLHGGFLSLIVCLCAVAAGEWLRGNPAMTKRYTICAAACLLSTVLNPYGIQLHIHIVEYLRSDWIRDAIDEFQSPKFRSEAMLYYEALLVTGAIAVFSLARRKAWPEALLILGWIHLSLGAVRHVPIYLIVAGPIIASELTLWWNEVAAAASRRSVLRTLDQLSTELQGKFNRASAWIALPVFALIAFDRPFHWPRQFPEKYFPIAFIEKNAAEIRAHRVLAPDEWGDYMIYRFFPEQRVFFDGRSDFFGPEVGKDYIALMQGGAAWRQLLEKYRFDAVMVPPEWPLQSLLRGDRGWQVVQEDKQVVLFRRVNPSSSQVSAPIQDKSSTEKVIPGLLKPSNSAERTVGASNVDHERT